MSISGISSSFSWASSVDGARAQSTSSGESRRGKVELTDEEERKVEELKKRDAEVRRHEQAHLAAAGQYAKGAPKYEFETGPDRNQYAVGGEVSIDTSPVPDDPAATIRKAEIIKRAAYAPAEPSAKDRQVAAEADRMKMKAQQELAKKIEEDMTTESGEGGMAAKIRSIVEAKQGSRTGEHLNLVA